MKASELRIGNLVTYNGKEISITPNALFEFYYIHNTHANSKIDRRDYKPILLTEEFLLRAGFKKGTLIYKNDSFNFNGEIVFKGEDSFRYFGTNAKLKYVHQLQNLYFALTGEELTIKTEQQ